MGNCDPGDMAVFYARLFPGDWPDEAELRRRAKERFTFGTIIDMPEVADWLNEQRGQK